MIGRRAGVAILFVLTLLVLLGFAAFAMDLGYSRMIRAQLQAAADAAALSAAPRLDKAAAGMALARQTAVDVAAANIEKGNPVILDPNGGNIPEGDVVLGIWDATGRTFTASTDPAQVNAVQVTARDLSLVPLFSRAAFGTDQLGAAARSIGVAHWLGAGRVNWYLPFGLPLCVFQTLPRDTLSDHDFMLGPAGIDTTGWIRVGGTPNSSWIRSEIQGILPCMDEYVSTGGSTTVCASASVGDSAGLNNGADQAALRELANTLEAEGAPWDSDDWGSLPSQHPSSDISHLNYGKVLYGAIPIFEGGPSYCSPGGGSWNRTVTIAGFVMAAIYDVAYKGSVSKRHVWLRIDVETGYNVGDWWGGPDYGVVASAPAELVQ